ncbi:hypothetical protein N9338_09040 [Luminiphilus sp.]|nr:hypothetical protein [Luminiphilus sp.]
MSAYFAYSPSGASSGVCGAITGNDYERYWLESELEKYSAFYENQLEHPHVD